tara:strand:- start:569 stop:1138 length:570 start_codon:yes stop_codon:yes gene_type:complete
MLEEILKRQSALTKVPFELAKAQAKIESGNNPWAKSPVGALGLFQVMPGTAAQFHVAEKDLLNPELCTQVGLTYLRSLFDSPKLQAIGVTTTRWEQWQCALACYNGGPGYTHIAIGKARVADDLPYTHNEWMKAGGNPGSRSWALWAEIKNYLPEVTLRGKKPDHNQITDYVYKISCLVEQIGADLATF